MKEYHIDKIFKSRWEKMLDWYSINKRDLPWRRRKIKIFIESGFQK